MSPAPGRREHEGVALDLRHIVPRLVLLVGLAVVVAVAVATLPGIGEVRRRLTSADPGWIAVTAGCSLASSLGFVVALWGAFDRAVPRRAAVDLGFAEQGANVLLPTGGAGGPAFGTYVMSRAGVPTGLAAERHAAFFMITSAVSLLGLVLAGVLEAAGALPGDAPLWLTLGPAFLGASLLAGAFAFARHHMPERPGGRLRYGVWRLSLFVRAGARTSIDLMVRRRDPAVLGGAIAYYAFDIAALGASFQAFGGDAPPVGLFILAYTLGHAGALLPTPGGVGGTDGGLIGMFVVYDAPLAVATTAVLGYRVFQLGLPVMLGTIALLRIRSRLSDEEAKAAVRARYADRS